MVDREWMDDWYAAETGLDTSTQLAALPASIPTTSAINNAGWPYTLKKLAEKQELSRAEPRCPRRRRVPVFYNLA
jgi:hypothetical protein